ncbi:MAG: putative Diguanylate cyclase [Pseudonocardiales bacterium]|nr:putative Diguanylate cyclase [Pseudonocardiales bacterium]
MGSSAQHDTRINDHRAAFNVAAPRLMRHVRMIAARWNPEDSAVQTGRALLLATGVVVTSTVGALSPSDSDWMAVGWVSVTMCAVFVVSFVVPWRMLPSASTTVFPVAVISAIAALGVFARPEIGSCYLGLFVLCFAHVGVFQPLHSAFVLIIVGAPAYLLAENRWDAYIAIRLAIACAIWVILGEVLALLMRHQHLITELLQRAAQTDVLTGVGTRRDLDNHVGAVGFGDTFVLCDLDHFKRVNDTLGHAAGDTILRDFGAILRGSLRGDDYAGRYGGEEFVLILADTDETETEQVLDRLRIRWMATGHTITFSAGYATHRRLVDPHLDLASADAALYAAKAAGRNRTFRAEGPLDQVSTAHTMPASDAHRGTDGGTASGGDTST